jgi:hypothetical protein
MRLANAECLRITTRALLANLQRFPGDFRTICLALQHLGKTHADFVQFYVEVCQAPCAVLCVYGTN